ncbi:curli production assembly/transport component CsgG [Lutibacter oricola]|uniref:Curli production assembly/transport component CsgG n=1 Tax=Lutibacter oricola TaxID=762486 RepID=A0A1H3GNH3_9FLAO|nr:CsgG/HfaB family protein [Lutibacter oricola]SDY04667.1 curli production assembly/transport component CsgG [Lutibacter oricola]
MNKIKISAIISLLFLFSSCAAYFNQPLQVSKARLGENTSQNKILKDILPVTPTIVGVYKFRDQTGQYKLVENGSSWSTAITQGGTSILLKSLEDSKWFTAIERENVSNLLNERQIIRSTRQEYSKGNKKKEQISSIPPLLFAGVLLEGGVVSYDSNIITGGSGARYFGAGGSVEYREDRITVYLRAVSTSNGQILKTVYTSKTILSQGISANLFRYVNLKRLLEVETGVTRNEPAQLAVKEAIDKAVETLIVEGVIDGLWKPQGGEPVVQALKERYEKEKEDANSRVLYDRKLEDRRGKTAVSVTAGTSHISGDYSNPKGKLGTSLAYKFYFNKPNLNLNLGLGYFQLENEGAFKDDFVSFDINLEYDVLPYDNFTPFLYAGLGTISNTNLDNPEFKVQYGLGVEYLATNNIGIKLFGEQNVLMTDDFDGLIRGKRDDFYWKVGLGLNFYIGKPYNKVKSVLFE